MTAYSSEPSYVILQGRRLVLARLAWLALVMVPIGLLLYSYPDYLRSLSALKFDLIPLSGDWPPQRLAGALADLGLAPGLLAVYIISFDVLQLLSFFIMGGLIFWRKSNTLLGLFASYALIGIGTTIGGGSASLPQIGSPWQELIIFTSALVWPALFIFLFLFPDGQFRPRWTRLFVPLWGLFFVWYAVSDLILKLGFDTFQAFGIFFMLLSIAAALVSQVYRYLRVSGGIDRQQIRQQIRWFLFAIALLLFWSILENFLVDPFLRDPGLPAAQALLWSLAWQPVGLLAMSSLPIAIAIALFRYRLWDIDVIIRKTLVYTGVTSLLALVFFGSVVLLQSVFNRPGGEQSPAIIVLSTLAIAALFNPLRQRVQAAVDRRFYRSKYDANQALANFAALARDEVDMEHLSAALISAVDQTVQPEGASLWLRGSGQ